MANLSLSGRLFAFFNEWLGGNLSRWLRCNTVNGYAAHHFHQGMERGKEIARSERVCRAVAIFLLTLCAAQFAFAQPLGQPDGGKISPGLVQKQAFVQSLVENASLAEYIQASQDTEVLSLVALAKHNYASALAGLRNGDIAVAENQLNEVMYRWILLLSLQMQPTNPVAPAARQPVEGKRLPESYGKLLGTLEFLEMSYRSYEKRAAPPPVDASLNGDGQSARLAEGLAEARRHVAMGQEDGALRALKNVAQLMKPAINRMLDSVAVDYALKFKTPAEEYAYELERNRSYLELVPVAIAEFNPMDDEKLAIKKLVEKNRLAIGQARNHAEQQDYQRALDTVHTGMGFLELALKTAGLVAPYIWISSNDYLAFVE